MSGSQSALYGGGPTLWVSGANYEKGRLAISPSDFRTYVRKIAGAGTTDPASDSTNWQPAGASAIKSIQRGVMSVSYGTPTDATISSVNMAKTELRFLGNTDGSGSGGGQCQLTLASATTIKAINTAGNSTVSWELTERY